MLNEQRARPTLVYKYVLPDRVDVLENSTIRFTQPAALNDPFELKPLFSQIMPDEMFDEELRPSSPRMLIEMSTALTREYDKLPSEVKRKVSLQQIALLVNENPQLIQGAFDQLVPSFKVALKSFVPKMKEMLTTILQLKIGILSLSSEITNPVMWAHYADGGKGFAYEFDARHSFFDRRRSEEDEFFYLRPVHYLNRKLKGRSLLDLNGDDILVTKAESWSYENEWRILAPLDSAARKTVVNREDIYLFEIPPKALLRIVIGANVDLTLLARIKNVLRSSPGFTHVTMAQMQANLESHQMEVVPIQE